MLIDQKLVVVRLVVAVVLSVCYLVLLLVAKPYAQRSTAFVAVATQLTLTLTLVAALVVKLVDAVRAAVDVSGASTSDILGFDSAFPLTIGMLAANLGVLVVVLCLIIQQAAEERKRNMLLSPRDLTTLVQEMEHAAARERAVASERARSAGDSASIHMSSTRSAARSSAGKMWLPFSPGALQLRVRTKVIKMSDHLTEVSNTLSLLSKGSKHECSVRDLITGRVEEAAHGLPHFMGVPDPFAAAGVHKIVEEIATFIATLREMTEDDLQRAGFARYARAGEPGGPKNERAAILDTIEREVQGNLDYILNETSSEVEFHNGVRDLERAFGQFCVDSAVEDPHKEYMRSHPCFFLDPECEVYR
eukprot:4116115-Prymnesium_polylepis.1